MAIQKVAYIGGPLSDLSPEIETEVKAFYTRLGDALYAVTGRKSFVPHEHCDPIKMKNLTPAQVDAIERPQVCERTSLFVAVDIFPSTGMGIEVEMAYRSGVPIVILAREGKKISRLFSGNPGVVGIIRYTDYDDAIEKLRFWALQHWVPQSFKGFDPADTPASDQPALVGFDPPDAV